MSLVVKLEPLVINEICVDSGSTTMMSGLPSPSMSETPNTRILGWLSPAKLTDCVVEEQTGIGSEVDVTFRNWKVPRVDPLPAR